MTITTVLHGPQLLILDEPFSGFDPINAELIRLEILRMRDEGVTVMLSTHNMGSVEELCEHIALIDRSKVVLHGSVKDIRKQYSDSTYTIEFKGSKVAFANALAYHGELIDPKEDGGLFAEIITAELNRRDHIIASLAEGTFAPAASALFGTMADDLAKMSRDARSMTLPAKPQG